MTRQTGCARLLMIAGMLVLLTGRGAASTISLNPTVMTRPEGTTAYVSGNIANFPAPFDPPFEFLISISASDPRVIGVLPQLEVDNGQFSMPVLFAHPGTATVTVTLPDGVSASATMEVTPAAVIALISKPPAILQQSGVGGGTASVTVVNVGSIVGEVRISTPNLPGFSATPASFSLDPDQRQNVKLTAGPASVGNYQFSAANITIADVIVLPPGRGNGSVRSQQERVEQYGPVSGVAANGLRSSAFCNNGTTPVTAVAVSDVPWLNVGGFETGSGVATTTTLEPGACAVLDWYDDVTMRPDWPNPIGSITGRIEVIYVASSPQGKTSTLDTSLNPSTAGITFVGTIPFATAKAQAPPLGSNEIALFLPGIGHIAGSVGTFASDLGLLNRFPGSILRNINLYFSPTDGTPTQSGFIPQLLPSQAAVFRDVAALFGGTGKVGTLQVRFSDLEHLGAAASVLNISNPRGTYGTDVPVFRSDRAARTGDTVYLVGLRADGGAHTNLYLQEAAGQGVSVNIRFLDAAGQTVTDRTENLDPFALHFLGSVVPAGVVSMTLTQTAGAGSFLAYATPVDPSGDTWTVLDWRRQFGASSTTLVIPVAGVVHGAANSFFHTDIAVMNIGAVEATARLRLMGAGSVVDRTVTLQPSQTFIGNDIVGSLFGIEGDAFGFVLFTPLNNGLFEVTSRTFSTQPDVTGSFGMGVPTLPPTYALTTGESRQITSIDDAQRSAVGTRPGTYRANFGFLEIAGGPVVVKAELRFGLPLATSFANIVATKNYVVQGGQLLQFSLRDILGEEANNVSDIYDATLEFIVTSGTGAVIPYVTTNDNGTNDPIFRVN